MLVHNIHVHNLKALCRAASIDDLHVLVEAAHSHTVMNTGWGGWLINLCVHSNLPAVAHSAGCSIF